MKNPKENAEKGEETLKESTTNTSKTPNKPPVTSDNFKAIQEESKVIAKEIPKSSNSETNNSNNSLESFTIKAYKSDKARFKEMEGHLTHGEFLRVLLDSKATPVEIPEPQIIEKEIIKEVINHVEKSIPENAILLQLTEPQKELLKQISIKRFNKLAQKAAINSTLTPETIDKIILAMVFNPDRLANLDNAFYTGVTQQMIKP